MISLICVSVRKNELIDTEDRLAIATGREKGVEKMGEGGKKVQTSIYKSRQCNVQHGDYS